MKIDLLLNTSNKLNPQSNRITKGQEAKKSFADLFNDSLRDTTNSTEITSNTKEPVVTKPSNEQELDERQYEVAQEEENSDKNQVLEQVYFLLLQIEEHSIPLEDGLMALNEALEALDMGLVDGELAQLFSKLKELSLDLASLSEELNLMEETPKEVRRIDDLTELKVIMADARKLIELEKVEVNNPINQPQQVLNTEAIEFFEVTEETVLAEINLFQKETNKEVKKSDLLQELVPEIALENPTGEISMEATRQFHQVINQSEDEATTIDPKVLIQEVANKAKVLVEKGRTEMKIQLMPENLGNIFINITMEKGTLSAKMYAENQQIKEMIDANLDQLRIALGDKGINISKLEVSISHNQQDFSGRSHFFQQKNKLKLKKVNNHDAINSLQSMDYVGDISASNPYLINSKFNGLA